MIDNSALLDRLFETNAIRLRRGRVFDGPPASLPPALEWDRIRGMMLGLAIGDALGNPTEGYSPARRRAEWGEIRDYLAHPSSFEAALPTDDTQLAFWTLDQLVTNEGFEPAALALRFCEEQIFGIGSAVNEALATVRSGAHPWHACGAWSAGDGALMRIAPMLIPHLRQPSRALWADTALSAIVTHNDPTSTSACLVFVAMLWQLLAMDRAPEPLWWPQAYAALARDLEGETRLRSVREFRDYEGPLWRFVAEQLPIAWERGLSALQACETWCSGAFLLETVPSLLYILMCHADDPEEAIVRAVNDTRDNDTIAAIVGAAVGALHGDRALPQRWVTGLKGRTREDDDGEVQAILERARLHFWEQSNLGGGDVMRRSDIDCRRRR